ncbi:similar to Saccharomyces cerevisiae YCR067C SED4 Integral endoplasmic reticulum membrane protein that stimulates Sar1p GTPase activity [Maudiozyma saulgeensis]|uniref:Guanine nucleotide-exchange factor SEC12 n=1 Tax=Maudiozyma saulgeensis TaxID=1789683 RepID=A0A1X7R7J4_9SACH|nr:similar to Saccharomyces cerevisiae YCR067C SED4 Integral endoplasmic reticulum membrane protein that stimulates Sar1p GTPase activity [Kazachstania saulgeensis]
MKFNTCTLNVEYPVYGAQFLDNSTLLIAGGGGEGKNGIPNKLNTLTITETNTEDPKDHSLKLKSINEFELEAEDDSPTALDAHSGVVLVGCNENSNQIQNGKGNKHIRKFTYNNEDPKHELKFIEGIDFDKSKDPNEYTKLINISKDGTLAAIASSNEPTKLRIIHPDEMSEIFEIESSSEIKDLQFSPNGKLITYITKNSLEMISTVTGKCVARNVSFDSNLNLSKIRFIDNDRIVIAASFIKGTGIVLIAVDIKSGKATITKSKLLSKKFKGITSMDVDSKGQLGAISTNDNSLILIKLGSLQIGKLFKQVHDFAITKVAISPDSRYVASVSAANTVNVISVPRAYALSLSKSEIAYKTFTRFILIVLLAILFQHIVQNDLHSKFMQYVADLNERRSKNNSTQSNYFVQTTLVGKHTTVADTIPSGTLSQ